MRIDPSRLAVGMVVVYRLCPAQQPIQPEREWRGRITRCPDPAVGGTAVQVESLEPGHEGLTEWVLFQQVSRIEPKEEGEPGLCASDS